MTSQPTRPRPSTATCCSATASFAPKPAPIRGAGRIHMLAWPIIGLASASVLLHAAEAPRATTELRRDEQLLLFPALAIAGSNGQWSANFRAAVVELEPRRAVIAAAERIIGLAPGELSDDARRILDDRARWLLLDNERGKRVVLKAAGQSFDLGQTAEQGHAEKSFAFSPPAAAPDARTLAVEAVLPAGDPRLFRTELHLVGATGLSVVSDIDDTIKVSVVTNKQELLRNTFLRPFREVPGMADLFRHWSGRHRASFHYVSASPWQLYGPLAEFARSSGFPSGTFHLKEFRWRDEKFLNLFEAPGEYKIRAIEPLLRAAPQRRFVLVGDSGERDPEAYGELARRHPAQVAAIFIRELAAESASSPRYQKAFERVPPERWRIFQSPEAIRDALP